MHFSILCIIHDIISEIEFLQADIMWWRMLVMVLDRRWVLKGNTVWFLLLTNTWRQKRRKLLNFPLYDEVYELRTCDWAVPRQRWLNTLFHGGHSWTTPTTTCHVSLTLRRIGLVTPASTTWFPINLDAKLVMLPRDLPEHCSCNKYTHLNCFSIISPLRLWLPGNKKVKCNSSAPFRLFQVHNVWAIEHCC